MGINFITLTVNFPVRYYSDHRAAPQSVVRPCVYPNHVYSSYVSRELCATRVLSPRRGGRVPTHLYSSTKSVRKQSAVYSFSFLIFKHFFSLFFCIMRCTNAINNKTFYYSESRVPVRFVPVRLVRRISCSALYRVAYTRHRRCLVRFTKCKWLLDCDHHELPSFLLANFLILTYIFKNSFDLLIQKYIYNIFDTPRQFSPFYY